ncbi:hypothetical protein AB0H86_30870 [Streptomyces sp. NPDC050997]|uniref:hypothetical protein n=1 Tax=Streptomyces sp. NPDC050997 TaxID=3155519 RepID=UPI00344ABEA5
MRRSLGEGVDQEHQGSGGRQRARNVHLLANAEPGSPSAQALALLGSLYADGRRNPTRSAGQ